MPKDLGQIESTRLECEECSAEIVVTTLYKPRFRDLSPLCPYCHFPMTTEQTVEELRQSLEQMTAQLEARVKEDAA